MSARYSCLLTFASLRCIARTRSIASMPRYSTVVSEFGQLGVDDWLAERVSSLGINTPTEVQSKVY